MDSLLRMDKSDHDLAQIIWDYMRYEQPLHPSDLILGMGCNDMRVADHCAKLFLGGYAPVILFSGSRGELTKGVCAGKEAELYRERALSLGVPDKAIIVESRAENSGQNLRYAYEKLAQLGNKPASIILVHKPYMLRRAFATFMKQWPGVPKPKVITSAIDLTMDDYATNAYIDISYMTNIMVGDLQRIIEYPKLGFQIEQDVPDVAMVAYKELVQRGYTKHLLQDV